MKLATLRELLSNARVSTATGKKILVLGGAVLLIKGLYMLSMLLTGNIEPETPVVLGATAETLIGMGIVLSDLIEPNRP